MEYRYKQLEQELSGLSKVLSDLGARLSEAAKDAATSGVMPSEKLLEQITASRASFESARATVHGHAAAMLVSPLPKPEDLISLPAMSSLLKAAAAAEENRLSIEGERDRVLKTLARALTLAHKENTEFKPLQECHAKVAELRNAVYNVAWPHRHPDSESLAASRHPVNALLNFVENLDTIEDEQWIALEATIAGAFGKPLFVAASRGKLEVRAEAKSEPAPKAEVKLETKPVIVPPAVQAKAPVAPPSESAKPVVAAEKPVEKPVAAEKASERPTGPITPTAPAAVQQPITQKKIVMPATPAAAGTPAVAAVAEKKEVAQEKSPAEKPVAPTTAPESAPSVPGLTLVTAEKKEAAEKPQSTVSPSPVAPPSPAVSSPSVASVPPAILVSPAATAGPSPVMRATPAPSAPAPTVGSPGPVPPPSIPSRVTPMTPVAAAAPAPAAPLVPAAPVGETNSNPAPSPAVPAIATTNSLSALASATEPSVEKKPAAPISADAAENQRRDPRQATPIHQGLSKSDSSEANGLAAGDEQKTSDNDGQRPQRWGFWRGNR